MNFRVTKLDVESGLFSEVYHYVLFTRGRKHDRLAPVKLEHSGDIPLPDRSVVDVHQVGQRGGVTGEFHRRPEGVADRLEVLELDVARNMTSKHDKLEPVLLAVLFDATFFQKPLDVLIDATVAKSHIRLVMVDTSY